MSEIDILHKSDMRLAVTEEELMTGGVWRGGERGWQGVAGVWTACAYRAPRALV